MGELVVGVDGSDGSRVALAWAVEEARLHGDDLTVVTVMPSPNLLITPAPIGEDLRRRADMEASHRARALLEEVIAPYADAGVTITSVVMRDDATFHALTRRAADADAVVVGSRGLGALRRMLLGSVSSQVAVHAETTVVVVPAPSEEQRRDDKVVVGIDGSTHAGVALRRAAVEAALRGWELELVMVQPPPPVAAESGRDPVEAYMWAGTLAPEPVPHSDELADDYQQATTHWRNLAEGLLEAELDRLDAATLPDKVTPTVIGADHPARALLDVAAWAKLLVLGRRGRGGFTGMLLGSISQHCVRHAMSPVMIVPPNGA
ncbi:MAG TPA: universal stress protein [Euzebyales bacterium]|nr:universal stress protein [Euzebyales bacterium]